MSSESRSSESSGRKPEPAANTLHQALAWARSLLAGTPDAARDAEMLLRHITGLSRASLLAHPERPIAAVELAAFQRCIERRSKSEPVQYITGVQEFYGLTFHVTPAVLIPRPETEHLVEYALEIARASASPQTGPLRILDIGTGSGAIAVTLAHLLPHASLVATDISAAALEVARHNAASHSVEDRITFIEGDLMPPADGAFHLICSNPPYVPSGEVLEPQVAAYEPHGALFAGPEGLDVYRRLIPLAAAALLPGGSLLLEVGHGQQAAVHSLLYAAHLQGIRFVPDLQGIPRVAIAQRPGLGPRLEPSRAEG